MSELALWLLVAVVSLAVLHVARRLVALEQRVRTLEQDSPEHVTPAKTRTMWGDD